MLMAVAVAAQAIVSTEWLQANLNDPQVRIVYVGNRDDYDHGHIPGARPIEHMATVGSEHRPLPLETLAAALTKAGAADGAHIVLYGNSPMDIGWIYMTFAATGHGDDVSLLDGNLALWKSEHRQVATNVPPPPTGVLTVRPAPDVVVDAPWVRSRLKSTDVKVLDVRSQDEWKSGHLPGATLILWQDLYADRQMQKFKPLDQIRALVAAAGVGPGQQAVTYCAIGMRASLMYFALHAAGIPARVYVGSWEDWRRDSTNPISK